MFRKCSTSARASGPSDVSPASSSEKRRSNLSPATRRTTNPSTPATVSFESSAGTSVAARPRGSRPCCPTRAAPAQAPTPPHAAPIRPFAACWTLDRASPAGSRGRPAPALLPSPPSGVRAGPPAPPRRGAAGARPGHRQTVRPRCRDRDVRQAGRDETDRGDGVDRGKLERWAKSAVSFHRGHLPRQHAVHDRRARRHPHRRVLAGQAGDSPLQHRRSRAARLPPRTAHDPLASSSLPAWNG